MLSVWRRNSRRPIGRLQNGPSGCEKAWLRNGRLRIGDREPAEAKSPRPKKFRGNLKNFADIQGRTKLLICDKAHLFYEIIPDVIGAIDGCHIMLKAPEDQQESYLNRNFHLSIILQGICTSKELFTNVFVGFPGSAHDARVIISQYLKLHLYKLCISLKVLRESSIFSITQQHGTARLFYGTEYHLIGDSA